MASFIKGFKFPTVFSRTPPAIRGTAGHKAIYTDDPKLQPGALDPMWIWRNQGPTALEECVRLSALFPEYGPGVVHLERAPFRLY